MKKQSKLSNIIAYIFIALAILNLMVSNKGLIKFRLPISLGYVYSGSMEPTIKTNDGYFLKTEEEYNIGDIITFKPKKLKENYITHRIIDEIDGKFITQGDHNTTTDQDAGEPLVEEVQILGKIFTINNNPIIIPKLGFISLYTSNLVSKLNVFVLISLFIFTYLLFMFFNKKSNIRKRSTNKKRLLDVSPYFDFVFILFIILLFINIFNLIFNLSQWKTVDISYVVVSSKGSSSPMPSEKFIKEQNLENITPFKFKIMLESHKPNVIVNTEMITLEANKAVKYDVIITAPDKIGFYKEQISQYLYFDILPDAWFYKLYSINKFLLLIISITPTVILNIIIYIWWNKRWQIGNRRVKEFLIPFRAVFKEW